MLIPLGILSSSGGGAAGSYELISSTVLGSSTSSVTFSSIVSTYKHLQLRYTARSDRTSASQIDQLILNFNGDTATNYSDHYLYGDGASVASGSGATQANIELNYFANNTASSGIYGLGIIDILDYSSSSKYKTVRCLGGSSQTTPTVGLYSGNWRSTSAITSLTLDLAVGPNFMTGSRFSLYGIKG